MLQVTTAKQTIILVTSDCLYLLSCDRALGLDKTYNNSEDPEDEQSNQNDTPFSRLMDGKC